MGFPFSASAKPALYSRSDDIPIISSASADELSDPANPSPDNFYANFYRIISPVSEESKVLADFVQNHLAPTQTQTLLFEDRNERYSQSLGSQAYSDLGPNNTAYYTEGEPDTLDLGIHDIIQNHYSQIFFSGFADDLDALKNKLNIARMNGELTWDIRIIGGEGLYDLGSYTKGNYANLFFTINATYAQISQDISLNGIQVPDNKNCPPQDVAPFTSHFNDEFVTFSIRTIHPLSMVTSLQVPMSYRCMILWKRFCKPYHKEGKQPPVLSGKQSTRICRLCNSRE